MVVRVRKRDDDWDDSGGRMRTKQGDLMIQREGGMRKGWESR